MRNRANPLAVSSAQLARAQRWEIGQAVTVTEDDGSLTYTVIRSAPFRAQRTWEICVANGEVLKRVPLARVVERAEVF